MKKDIEDLQRCMRAMEQHSRKTIFEISGIPATHDENILKLVKNIGLIIQQEAQVVAAHRVPSYRREMIFFVGGAVPEPDDPGQVDHQLQK